MRIAQHPVHSWSAILPSFKILGRKLLWSHASPLVVGRPLRSVCALFRAVVIAALVLVSGAAVSGDTIRAFGLPASATPVPSPEVEWIPSPNYNSRSDLNGVDSIVIHTTEVNYEGTLDIFRNTASQVSAHFVIAPDGHIVQMVDTGGRAWHATYYNSRSVGIEMVGYANRSSTWNVNNVSSLMDLLAWLVTAYDVPLVHPTGDAYDFANEQYDYAGLVAHGQVQPWNRTDPGPYFPWNEVLAGTQARIDAVPEPGCGMMTGLACAMLLGRRPRQWRR